MSLEILTADSPSLKETGIAKEVRIGGEPARFVRGMKYEFMYPQDGKLSSLPEIELFYEGKHTKELYIVTREPHDKTDFSIPYDAIHDTRYEIFGNLELYKTFFEVLDSDFSSDSIQEAAYVSIYTTIKRLANELHAADFTYFALPRFLLRGLVLCRIQEEFNKEPIKGYLGRAQQLMASKKG